MRMHAHFIYVAHMVCVHTTHSDVYNNWFSGNFSALAELTELQNLCVGGMWVLFLCVPDHLAGAGI